VLDHQTLIDHLRYNEFFELLPAHVRTQLFNKSKARSAKAGEVIYRAGDAADYMGALLSGRVRICVPSYDGREVLLNLIERGRVFGETSVLDGLPRHINAIADEDCSYLVIRRDDFLPILFQYPDAMFRVVNVLCHRTRLYVDKIEQFALLDLPTRLAYSLLRLSKKYGKEREGKVAIHAGLNQTDLGHQLASSRESVNKQLKAFAEKGYLETQGQEIVLLDIAALEKIAFPIQLDKVA
jgi:CRP-like cAMP-binding protein